MKDKPMKIKVTIEVDDKQIGNRPIVIIIPPEEQPKIDINFPEKEEDTNIYPIHPQPYIPYPYMPHPTNPYDYPIITYCYNNQSAPTEKPNGD